MNRTANHCNILMDGGFIQSLYALCICNELSFWIFLKEKPSCRAKTYTCRDVSSNCHVQKTFIWKYGGVQRGGNSVVKIQNGLLHWSIQACWKFNVFKKKSQPFFFGSPAQKIHSFCFTCAFWFCEISVILGFIVSFYHGLRFSFSILFRFKFVCQELLYLETIPA